MPKFRFFPLALIGAALAVSGCVGTADVSRDLGFDTPPIIENVQLHNWDVVSVVVDAPYTLTTSEANTIKPRADIVWREDPLGDRHVQVETVMTQALAPAFEAVTGDIPVVIELTVSRFHMQTQRVRYSNIPSEQELEFNLVVRHAETGEILSGPRAVDLTFPAYGGQDAVAADARGETQRVRIQQRLQAWVQDEFIGAAGTPLIVADAG